MFIRLYQLLFIGGILFISGGLFIFIEENQVDFCNRVVLCHHYGVEKLLGTALPSQVTNLHYFKWQLSPDLYFYEAYIKFSVSRSEFIKLMKRMKMDFYQGGKNEMGYLPTGWQSKPEVKLDWWNPKTNTPLDAASRYFGVNGWIVAKYEEGNVYIYITDTGNATPGPF